MNDWHLSLASELSTASLLPGGRPKAGRFKLALPTCCVVFAALAAQAQIVPIDYSRTGEANAGNTALDPLAICRTQGCLSAERSTIPNGTFYTADVVATTVLVPQVPDAPSLASPTSEVLFLAENEAAMTKMMKDMSVQPTGDVDRDFVAMMVPHHQGAIDMALAVLRYGHNEKVRRLAQEIIVTQQDEIAAMRLAVGEELPPGVASPTQSSPRTNRQAMSHDTTISPLKLITR